MKSQLDSLEALSLYHYDDCVYCEKTRRAIKNSSQSVELKNIQLDPKNRRDLIHGGGYGQVPCLRIDKEGSNSTWIYETASIIDYLITH